MDHNVISPRPSSVSTGTGAHPPPPPHPQSQRDANSAAAPGPHLRRGLSDSIQPSPAHRTGPSPYRGETWRDFLRETSESSRSALGPDSPAEASLTRSDEILRGLGDGSTDLAVQSVASSSHAAGRKRVPSTSAGESLGKRRSYCGTMPGTPTAENGTAANPIDLTSSPERTSTPAESVRRQNSNNSIVLPRWQLDNEVSSCPVCGTQFGLWYRRHHCRKCGRIVCANCSPHRITIPRQFIVQPPASVSASPFARLASLDDTRLEVTQGATAGGPGLSRIPTIAGGEVVRVCNPCVPDPNFSPPPQLPAAASSLTLPSLSGFALPQSTLWGPSSGPAGQASASPGSSEVAGSQSAISGLPIQPPQPIVTPAASGNMAGSLSPQRERSASAYSPASLLQARRSALASAAVGRPSQAPTSRSFIPSDNASPYRRSASLSAGGSSRPMGFRAPSNTEASLPPPPPTTQQRARPQIAEEDECPVCGRELPPKGPSGETLVREQHVQDCLMLYSSTMVSAPIHQPSGTTASNNMQSTSGAAPGSSASSAPSASAPMALPHRPTANRMLVYHATEKDCVGGDGEAQECVICFEEFEEGDEMGRLECLCKFHRACIRQWWNTKGNGACPTHQLHE